MEIKSREKNKNEIKQNKAKQNRNMVNMSYRVSLF